MAELIEDPLFTGTKSYCEVVGGALRLLDGDFDLVEDVDSLADWDTGGDGIVPVAIYQFAAGLDFGTVKSVRLTSRSCLPPSTPTT